MRKYYSRPVYTERQLFGIRICQDATTVCTDLRLLDSGKHIFIVFVFLLFFEARRDGYDHLV